MYKLMTQTSVTQLLATDEINEILTTNLFKATMELDPENENFEYNHGSDIITFLNNFNANENDNNNKLELVRLMRDDLIHQYKDN